MSMHFLGSFKASKLFVRRTSHSPGVCAERNRGASETRAGIGKRPVQSLRGDSGSLALRRNGLALRFVFVAVEVLVDHGGHSTVGPDVQHRFDHVDHGIDGKDHAHQQDGNVHARHEARRQEEAPHRDARVADGGDRGDQHPDAERAEGDFGTRILHEEDARNQNEGRAGVHVDGRTDGKHEAGDRWTHAHALFGAGHRDGKRSGGRLREEGDEERGHHAAGNAQGVEAADEKDERKHNKHLQEVRRQHGREVRAETADAHTARKFHAEGRDEAEDPDGKHLDQPLHEDEEHILASREERRQHFLGATLTRQLRNCKTDRGRDEKHRENVRREEGREEVVRDHRLHVCEIALFGHGRGRGRTVGKSHVRRTEKKVETRGKQRGENRRQERIEDRVTEDPTRFARLRDRSKGRNDRNRDDRDADELEKFDENRGDEVADGVRERRAVKAVHHAEHDGCEVEAGHDQLLALGFGRECGSSVDGHDEFPSLVGMSTAPPGAEYGRDSEKSE